MGPDSEVDIKPLVKFDNAELNENQDGFQQAFRFSTSKVCVKWPGTTQISI